MPVGKFKYYRKLSKGVPRRTWINNWEKRGLYIGGYTNKLAHELVALCVICIPKDKIPLIYSFSSNNFSENTMRIYMGAIEDVFKLL